MTNAVWAPALPPELASRAIAVAVDVAERVSDRRLVERSIAIAPAQTAYPLSIYWRPLCLAQGDAGIALACAYLDACFQDVGWDRTAHEYLTVAAADAQRSPSTSAAMFGGLAGLGFAAWSLSRRATRYRRLLAEVDAALFRLVAVQAEQLAGRTAGMSVSDFDVITGLAGAGRYLMCRSQDSEATRALDLVLGALVALTSDGGGRPSWWTPPGLMGSQEMAEQYPHGNLNCGLAHGIPGPVALMSLALVHGADVPGLAGAVDRQATWLTTHRVDDQWGVNWPVAVGLTPEGIEASDGFEPSRAAWCYGAPGVARALWLAGVALDRSEWRDLAVGAMEAVYRRPVPDRRIDSPTFCHGVAGLLQVTLRFAHDTRLPVFSEAACALVEQMLGMYEPDSVLGYRSFEPGGGRVDQAGLLDGAPGASLSLLAAATDNEPFWDRAFLLA